MSSLPREATRILRQRQAICSRCLCRIGSQRQQSLRWNSTNASSATIPRVGAPGGQDYFFANDAFQAYAQKGLKALSKGFWSQTSPRRAVQGGAAAKLSHLRTRMLQTSSTGTLSTALAQPTTHASRISYSTTTITTPSTSDSPQAATDSKGRAVQESTLPAAHTIPPDASARLSARARQMPPSSLRRQLALFLSLSKPRLTFLMVLTTASAYSLFPEPELLSASATATPSLSALTLVFLTSGTALCSASANALNMFMEPEHDAKMSRTRNRPLVRGLLSGRAAVLFAIASGVCGTGLLYFGVNPTVAFLGAANIGLYAGVYTPLKRLSVLNTWAGAVVGAIPPLMGWAAAAGQSAADGGWQELLLGEQNAGGWLLAALLFAWQFPHFNALSWTIREEYKAAGYRMMAWVNERRNARVALRYSLLFFPICAGLAYAGVTDRGYVITSSVVNLWIARQAYRFWKFQGQKGTARALFWAGVWQLPVLMVLAMLHKKGLWDGVWSWAVGEQEEQTQRQEAVAV